MAHDTARVSPRLHQTHENWEASHDFPRFSDGSMTPPYIMYANNVAELSAASDRRIHLVAVSIVNV